MNYEEYYKRFVELVRGQDYDLASMNYAEIDKHIVFLKQLAQVENSSVAIVDVYKQNYLFMQSKYLASLGKDMEEVKKEGQKVFFGLMHPDDVSFVIETHCRSFEFILQQPIQERLKFKTVYDFRLKDKNGKYVRFIQQVKPLELDSRGNIWLMLMLNDIILDTGEFRTQQRRLFNCETGKLFQFDNDESGKKNILSKREVEILGLLSKGMASRQVADELFISVNTVNNHRRNILEKTSAENTAEAIRYASGLGLM